MEWFKHFWKIHGERHVYATYALIMAIGFIYFGHKYPDLKTFNGAGETILIGLAMYAFNKVRGNGKEPEKPTVELK